MFISTKTATNNTKMKTLKNNVMRYTIKAMRIQKIIQSLS